MTLFLTVSDEVRALAPGFRHLAIEAHGLVNGPSTEASSALLDEAARRLAVRLDGRAPHEDPHMAAWREVYTAFGSKPSRTRNSAEALAKRALSDAGLPRSTSWSTSTTRSASRTSSPSAARTSTVSGAECGSYGPPATRTS
jgi:DNA/RNA-binding domain of Phe-tRNA-synthetase-like protein